MHGWPKTIGRQVCAGIIYPERIQSTPITLKESVAKISFSYHGEIKTLFMTAEYMVKYSVTRHIKGINIISDCKSAIQSCL